ncbi:MAG: ABC transporter substrate-binding protein [Spirochaetaceae bacterium]|jgi:peptide/nickel transport system substrate-binding protein|nr:ABC transporter substrate-binding protein [Spirochaetaceae bacterium]
MMKKIQSAALTLAAALVCALPGYARPGREASAPAHPPAHIAGGEIRYGFSTEPATLDPLSPANTADGRSILFNVFEGLVRPLPDGGLEAAVAETYRIEQNGRVYVFTLRRGLKFHDGTAVKAEDVEFTLNEAVRAGFSGFTQIEKVEVTPEGEIRITLKTPDPEFLPYLTIGVVPKNNADREKNPIGTGPFSIQNYTVQRSLTLVKNPDYWRPGTPSLDKVTVVFVADSNALLLALQGGSIDGATITGGLLQQLPAGRFDIVPSPSNAVQLLALNNAVKPLDDRRVRQAINYAVDVPEIIAAAFYGRGEPSGSPLIPGLSRYYEPSLANPYPADIPRARRLLSEAGYPQGFSLEITVPSNYTMHVDTAQVVVNQLRNAGISATIRLVDWAAWLSEVYRGRQYQATIISLDAGNVSPRGFLSRYRSDGGGNFINFKSPDFDRLYDAAQIEIDEAKRLGLYREAQRIVSEHAASVYIQDIWGFQVFPRGRYGGVVNYPLYAVDFSTMFRTE